jgi:HD domain-containing protein
MFSPMFETAFTYANRLHATQVRKQAPGDPSPGIPYITHLMAVASLVAEFGGTEDQVIGGLLHDAAEDRGGQPRLDEIRHRFGEAVATIVGACSDSLDATEKKAWCVRKCAYIAGIADKHEPALLVTAADKLHNMRAINADYAAIGPDFWHRFPRKRADIDHEGEGPPHRTAGHTYWYHERVRVALAARAGGTGPAGLARIVAELARENDRLLVLAASIEQQTGLEAFDPCRCQS